MPTRPRETEIKITIAKLLEVAYRENKGVTAALVREAAGFRLTLDEAGHLSLSGKAGLLRINAAKTVSEIGLGINRLSVTFSRSKDGHLKYTGSLEIKPVVIAVSGVFDIQRLLFECTGLLCQAARLLRGREIYINQRISPVTVK